MVIFSLLHQGHSLSQLGKPESIRNCSTTSLSGSHDLDQVFHFFGALFDAEAEAIFSQALWILILLLVPSCQGAIDLLNNVNQAATSFFAHIRFTHIHPVRTRKSVLLTNIYQGFRRCDPDAHDGQGKDTKHISVHIQLVTDFKTQHKHNNYNKSSENSSTLFSVYRVLQIHLKLIQMTFRKASNPCRLRKCFQVPSSVDDIRGVEDGAVNLAIVIVFEISDMDDFLK